MKTSSFYPVAIGFLLFAIGIIVDTKFDLNLNLWWFDDVMHLLGGVTVGWFFWSLAPHYSIQRLLFLTLMVSLLWELAEWWGEVYAPVYWPLYARYMQIGSSFDTLTDLLLDLLGATTFLVIRKK